MNVQLIKKLETGWMNRLRVGNRVWLVKEQMEATVEWAYEPSLHTGGCGRIGIQKPMSYTWFIDQDGNGINGDPLIRPIEGELPENPAPLSEPEIRQLQRAVEILQVQVRMLLEGSTFSWL